MAALVRVRRGVPVAGPGSLLPGERVAPEDYQRTAATVASLQRANELLQGQVGALTGELAAKDRELDQCRAEIARLQATVQAHKATIGEQVAKISKLKENQTKLVHHRKWLTDRLMTVRTQVQQLTAERDRLAAKLQRQTQLLEGERQTVQNMVVDQARQTADYQIAMEQLTGRHSKVVDENNQLRDRIAKVNEQYFTLSTAIQADQTAQEKAALVAERDALQATRDQLIAQVQNDSAVHDRSLAETNRLAALLAAKSQEYDRVQAELQSENVDWSEIYGKLKQEKAELIDQLASRETEIQRLSDQSDESTKRLARVVANYDALSQLYNQLKTMHDAAQTKMSEMERQYREAIDQRDREISDMQTKMSGAQASLAASTEHQRQHLTGIQRLSTERENLLAQRARHIETMDAQRKEIGRLTTAVGASGQEVAGLRARLNAAEAQNRALAEQCKRFEGRDQQYEATIARIGSEYQDAARRQLAESTRVCDGLKAALSSKEQEFAQLQAQLEASRVAAAAREQEFAQLQAQLAAATSAAAQSAQQLKSAQGEAARLTALRDKHVRIMDERQVDIDRYQAAAARSAEDLQQLRSRLGQITSENQQLTAQLEQLQNTLSTKEQQYSVAIGKNNTKNQGLLREIQKKLAQSKDEETRLTNVLAAKEREYAQLQAELSSVRKELAVFNSAGYQADRAGLARQINSLTAARELSDRSAQTALQDLNTLRAEQAALVTKHNELLQFKEQEIQNLNSELKRKTEELQRQQGIKNSTINRLEKEVADLRASAAKLVADQQQKSTTMQQQLSELQRTLEKTQSANTSLTADNTANTARVQSVLAEQRRLSDSLTQVQNQLNASNASNEALTVQLHNCEVELGVRGQHIASLKRALQETQQKFAGIITRTDDIVRFAKEIGNIVPTVVDSNKGGILGFGKLNTADADQLAVRIAGELTGWTTDIKTQLADLTEAIRHAVQ